MGTFKFRHSIPPYPILNIQMKKQKQNRNSHEPSLSFQNIAAIMLNHAMDPLKKIVVSGDCSNPSTDTDHQKGSWDIGLLSIWMRSIETFLKFSSPAH